MARIILVAIKKIDEINKMAPYVTRIAQPGSRILFLVRYRRDSLARFQFRLAVINGGDLGVLATRALAEWCSRETQKNLAEKAIMPLRKVLAKKGSKVAVSIHETSIRRQIRSYEAKGDVEMILMSASRRTSIAGFLHRVKAIFGRPRMPAIPVLAATRI